MVIRVNDRNNERVVDLTSFGKDVVSFGRQTDCDIVLNTDTVSRVHGAFYMENGVWLIEDLKSRNGITLDGGKVKRATAKAGREFILYDSKEKGRVAFTVLGEAKVDSEQEKPAKKSKKGLFIGLGVAAAAILAVVLCVIFLKGNGMTKEEKAYYEYLSDIIEDADFASEVHVEVEDGDETTYYCGYAIEDFDSDGEKELFLIKEIECDYEDGAYAEFYEYKDGEVKLSNRVRFVGGTNFPLTFYNNGIVMGYAWELVDTEEKYKYETSYSIYGNTKDYLEILGLLDRDNISDMYNNYSEMIWIFYNYETEKYDLCMIENLEEKNCSDVIVVDELTEKEYDDYFGFVNEENEVFVHIEDFSVDLIAEKLDVDPREYDVYEFIMDVDEATNGDGEVIDNPSENEEAYLSYGWYSIDIFSNKEAGISWCFGPNKEMVIPEKLGGYTITKINKIYAWFTEKVVIPDTVKIINEEAVVSWFDTLIEIEIPASVEKIEDHAVGYYMDWYEDSDGYELKKNKNLVIIGEKGSAAEKYAKDNGFDFKEKK